MTTTLLLLAALNLGQVDEGQLLAQLDADFERLVAKEPQAAELRRAALLLKDTNESDRWTNYSAATRILRETRPKAGIPLLLAYMVRHTGFGSSHVSVPEYAETLTILTGKDIPSPYRTGRDRKTPVLEAVDKLVTEWWEKERDKISTNMADWTPEQMDVLASRILKRAARSTKGSSSDPEEWREGPTSYAIYHLLYYDVMHAGAGQPDWRLEELHPKMAAAFLAPAGYRPDAKEKPARDMSRPAYPSVALLAALRKNGELDQLDEIAEDANQTAGTRLTCVMALFRADEKLKTDVLMDVAASDRNLERRLVAILALRFAEGSREAGAVLVKLLDEPNAEVRTAAICALKGPLPPQAVPKLKRVIDDLNPQQSLLFVFDVLGAYKNRDACEALAGFLAAGLEDRRKTPHLYYALSGLEEATGQRWGEAGPQTEAFYKEKAKAAIQWWKSEGRLKID